MTLASEEEMAKKRVKGVEGAVKIVLQGYVNKFSEIILPYVLDEQFSTTFFIFDMANYHEMKYYFGESLTQANAMQVIEDATECNFNDQTIAYLHVSTGTFD